MKLQWKKLLVCLAIPLAVGGLSALISGGMAGYRELNQPPLAPPGWVFPVVWSLLYLLMGYASYSVVTAGADRQQTQKALIAYGVQLFLNFLWSPVFFGLQWRLTAFWILLLLWAAIYITIRKFSRIDERAGDLLLPYILWVTFAGYLNLGVFFLN